MHRLAATTVILAALTAGTYTVTQDINAQGPPPGRGGPGRGGPGGFGGPGGPGGGGRGGPLRGILGPIPIERLGLTDAQREQAKAVVDGHGEAQRALRDRAFAAHEALDAVVMADTVDEAAIRARSAEVAALEADAAVARAKVRNQVWQILTPDQRLEAKRLQQEAPGRGPGGRRGPHGPPGQPRGL